jgi:hypothetical protein
MLIDEASRVPIHHHVRPLMFLDGKEMDCIRRADVAVSEPSVTHTPPSSPPAATNPESGATRIACSESRSAAVT